MGPDARLDRFSAADASRLPAGLPPGWQPGEPVRLSFSKYDGSPHWRYDLTLLGGDRYGVWLGGGPRSVCERPGRSITPGAHWVTLVPCEARYVATFNAPGGVLSADVYVDLTDPPVCSRDETGLLRIRAIDLDLDVVRRFSGACSIDDEDEFEAHRLAFGYPEDLVTATRAAAVRLHQQVRDGVEPYGSVGPGWLAAWQTDRFRDAVAAVERLNPPGGGVGDPGRPPRE